MTRSYALKILGVSENTPLSEIRKKYKSLMVLTHPDMASEHDYPFDAYEINAAYDFLAEHYWENDDEIPEEKRTVLWKASINANAYASREILSYAESSSGDIQGTICIASGKYVFSEDEDFSLFLLSIYNCSKKIIDDKEFNRKAAYTDEIREKLLVETAYLLAGQFVDPYMTLEKYSEGHVFKIPAMLEYTGGMFCQSNDIIYPRSVKNHRLYVETRDHVLLGYVSFKEDILYYCLIQYFEARSVLIKMEVKSLKPLGTGLKRYSDINLYLKFKNEPAGTVIDSINMKIDELFERYR